MIYGQDRELPPLYGLGWKPHRRVHLRYDGTHPLTGSPHQKIVVIDDKIAFVGGLDLATRRWDTPEHRPGDPRRVANGKPYPPFHDVMVAVDGDAARILACIARRRWHHATGETLSPPRVSADPWPEALGADMRDVEVGVACTAPATNGQAGTREVEQLYLDMIDGARRYIYIENQYFTARKVGERLAARLAEPDGPEIVVVTRLLSHGWLEEITMQRYFKRDAVRRIAGEKLNRLSHVLRKRGWLAVTAVRLVPLAPFAVENVVAGAVHVDPWHYMLGTFLGMLPGTLAATVFGDQLHAALTGGSSIDYTLVGGMFLLLAGGALAVRRWLAKLESEDKRPRVGETTLPPRKKDSDPVRGAACS